MRLFLLRIMLIKIFCIWFFAHQDVEGRQVDEAVLSLFHTLLFHRSTGKFHYKNNDTYAVGTIGFQDVDCDFIDFTYVSKGEVMQGCIIWFWRFSMFIIGSNGYTA